MKNDYITFLFVQLTDTLAKANTLLSAVTLDAFFVESDDVSKDTDNDLVNAMDAFSKVVECKKLITHARDLNDIISESVVE